jgi:RND family efflux transporter MFP subunit
VGVNVCKQYGVVGLYLLGFTLFFSACSWSISQTSADPGFVPGEESIPVVEAVTSRLGSLPLSERVNGTVISENQVTLYPEMSGRVIRVLAKNGDFVRRGDLLVVVDASQYEEQLKQAQASLRVNQAALNQAKARKKELEAQFRRMAMLAEEGLASQAEVETLQAQLDSAVAAIELAEAQIQESESVIEETRTILSKTEVRAPVTGTIGRRNAQVGMQVSTNTELFTIGDLNELRVEVVLTTKALQNVEVGQRVMIYAPAGAQEQRVFDVRLSRISPFLDPVTRSTEAEVDIRNRDNFLRPGMSVVAEILYGESSQATLVPLSAVFTHPTSGEEGVYVLPSLQSSLAEVQNDETEMPPLSPPTPAEFRPVEIVAEGRMEVGVSGLQPDAWVVTVGQNLLAEGRQQARVRKTTWERVLTLQSLQREDLLQEVLRGE